MKRILVPTDFSENAEHALKVAAQIARDTNGEIFLVHMLEIPSQMADAVSGGAAIPEIALFINKAHEKLEEVLTRLPHNDMAIVRHDALALLCELRGNLAQAIKHRRREIQLMQRLHREAALPRHDEDTRAYMLQGRDDAALADRQAILESLESRLELARQARVGNRDSLSV